MINQRFHFVVVVSVFLAVAVGSWIGIVVVDGDGRFGQAEALRDDTSRLRGEIDRLETDAARSRDFVTSVEPSMLKPLLADEQVLVVGINGADDEQIAAVTKSLSHSKAGDAGQLRFTKEFTDPANSESLVDLAAKLTPKGLKPPNTNDGIETVSALMAMTLLDKRDVPTGDRDKLIAALERLEMVAPVDELPDEHATAVLIVSGDGEEHSAGTVTFADRFGQEGATVLAGGESCIAVEKLRADDAAADRVSTVDNVDTQPGRVSAVLALPGTIAGEIGHYGTGEHASAAAPTP